MARKIKVLTIETDDRDKGKAFQITEMPASQAERWARHALNAVVRSGIDLPAGVLDMGMAGAFAVGFRVIAGAAGNDDLMGQLIGCAKFLANPEKPELARALVETDTEEITTRILLAKEAFDLHNFFSIADVLFKATPATEGEGS